MGLIGIISKLDRVEKIIDKVTPKVSVDTFMASVSDTIDGIIIKERQNNLQFIGGKAHFSLSGDQTQIVMYVELYMMRKGGGFVKKETNGTYPTNMLNQDAHDSFVSELMTEGEYIIEVKEP